MLGIVDLFELKFPGLDGLLYQLLTSFCRVLEENVSTEVPLLVLPFVYKRYGYKNRRMKTSTFYNLC